VIILLRGMACHINEGEPFDHSQAGDLAAASTEFVSVKSLRSLCVGFADFRARVENANQEPPLLRWRLAWLFVVALCANLWPGFELELQEIKQGALIGLLDK
jgi:hypothetical protein